MTLPDGTAGERGRSFPRRHALELLLFLTLLTAYGYFHQGGGWNQNIRFDQIRALAERGEAAVDAYAWFEPTSDTEIRRVGRRTRRSVPNSGDVASFEQRLYPNKPPGVSFLGLPAQLAIGGVQRLADVDPDRRRALTLNLFLVTVLTSGLLGALGGVVFLRLSRRLFPDVPWTTHLVATLAFALGTLQLPYATLLFDHVPAAVLLLLAYAALERAGDAVRAQRWRFLAGLTCGGAVLANYAAVLLVGVFVLHQLLTRRRPAELAALLAGGVLPAVLLFAYHAACFGSPLATSYTYQHEMFVDVGQDKFLGVFGLPDPAAFVALLFDPRLGLLTTAPVLFLAPLGFVALWRRGRRSGVLLLGGLVLVQLIMVASFNHWHGGAGYGPRYLMPIVPFAALPLAGALHVLPRVGAGLTLASILLLGAVTATDPQKPWSAPDLAIDLLTPGPSVAREHDGSRLDRFDFEPAISSNAMGAYELKPWQLFERGSEPARWNAFNLGEFVLGERLLSLAPLALALGAALTALTRLARARDERAARELRT